MILIKVLFHSESRCSFSWLTEAMLRNKVSLRHSFSDKFRDEVEFRASFTTVKFRNEV